MSRTHPDAEIAAIGDLSRAGLVSAWVRIYGAAPASGLSSRLMRKALAWEAQAKAYGGLSAQTKRALKVALGSGSGSASLSFTMMPTAGTRLVREWNEAVHDVEVLAEGFHWRGTHWSSLSAIAAEITGTKWSGRRFFGLRKATVKAAAASSGSAS